MQMTLVEMAQAVISVSGALSVIFGGAWAIARYTVRREFIPALKEHRDEYRAYHSDLFRLELQRGAESATAVTNIQITLKDLIEEMRAIRVNIGKHDETLITLPGILVNLNDTLGRHARTDDKLGVVLEAMGRDVNHTKIHIANIMGRLGMEPRREIDSVEVSAR